MMEAGRELDERLCQLLEPKPGARDCVASFWEWYHYEREWRPIPVSTEWAALGKAVDELSGRGYSIEIEVGAEGTFNFACVGKDLLDEWFPGDTAKHAFALAACEALEKEKEEK